MVGTKENKNSICKKCKGENTLTSIESAVFQGNFKIQDKKHILTPCQYCGSAVVTEIVKLSAKAAKIAQNKIAELETPVQ